MSTDIGRNIEAEEPSRMKRPQSYFIRKKGKKENVLLFLFCFVFYDDNA